MVTAEKIVLTVPEAGELLGISRAHAYLMVKQGQLPIIKLGRRLVVPRPALMKMLESVTPASVRS